MAREPAQDGISLRADIDESIRVEIEPVALQQVLLNLLINAVNAMREQGGGELSIQVDTGSTWNGIPVTRIQIKDTGPGIEASKLEHIFEPFGSHEVIGGRGDEGIERGGGAEDEPGTYPGTGLGLSIVRRLVENAGGKIEAHSRPGEGATFTVTLRPVVADHLRRSA